jgi:hypothetical protein
LSRRLDRREKAERRSGEREALQVFFHDYSRVFVA